MATNFSPCKGSYVLNQFPSNVMFGMNGFHVSASGAIQGHHGPLVFFFFIFIKCYLLFAVDKGPFFHFKIAKTCSFYELQFIELKGSGPFLWTKALSLLVWTCSIYSFFTEDLLIFCFRQWLLNRCLDYVPSSHNSYIFRKCGVP